MKNLELLANALEFIEEHLQDDIRTEDIADACYCSKSTIDKLFRNVNHISVRDYLIRRRMTIAARLLVTKPEMTTLDVGLQCGYSTPESFCRAFLQVWNCNPSVFRKSRRASELFPKIGMPLMDGGNNMSGRRRFEVSELYDLFRSRKGCYFVCCDIRSLIPINEISIKAGDLAILESMKRMEDAAGPEDVVFRIGGDEFVMLTDSKDIVYAEKIAEAIRAKNGEPVAFEGKEIPLSLYVSVVKVEMSNIKYDELFKELQSALKISKLQENK